MRLFATRLPFLLLCALIALSGSVVASLATQTERDLQLRGYVDATENPDLPYRVPRLGVNAELTQYSETELNQQLLLMQQAGVRWVRQIFPWDEIEPQPGEYAWARYDRIVEAVSAVPDLRIVAVLVNTPSWARDPRAADESTAPPQEPSQFAEFAAVFAERYGLQIDHYQVWDEPNLTANWGNLQPRPAEYAVLLQAAHSAIHSHDESAQVIAAALAPTTETGPENISDILYLRSLYELGAGAFMDIVAGKPYGFDTPPDDRTVRDETLNFSRFVALREVMVEYGAGTMSLWASNWGWNHLPESWEGSPSIWGAVNEAQRIEYTVASLDRAEREWPWLGAMILYHWQPDAPPDDPVWGFALVGQDGAPSSLLSALIARAENAVDDVATNGLYHPRNPFAEYSGLWTFSDLGADLGWQRDSRAVFDFAGQDVALLLRQDDYVAYLYAVLNGQPANALPRDNAGNAYVVLTSGTRLPELSLVQVSEGLPAGPHELELIAVEGEDRWALAGYAVSSGNLAEPYNTQIALAWLAAAVSGIAVIVSAWRIEWRGSLPLITRLLNRLGDAGQIMISIVTSLALMAGFLLTWGDAVPQLFRREPVQLLAAIFSAGLLYLNPAVVLTLIAALALFVIIYNRIALGLMLIVLFAPFFLFPVELFVFAFPMVELLLLITFAAWLLRALAAWGQVRQSGAQVYPADSLQLNLVDYGVLGLVVIAIISLGWTAQRGIAITELRTLVIEPALFYLMLRTTPLERRDVLRLFDALLAAGALVALIGLLLYFRGEAIITAEGEARRLASVYGSPNNVALFLGRCIPLALAFTLLPLNRVRRTVAVGILAVILLAVLFTQSVGGIFVGVPAAVALVLLLVYQRRAVLPLLALTVVAVIGFALLASQSERFARALDFSQGTNFYRLRVWESALEVIADQPLTGLGLDQFLYVYRGTYIRPDAWQEPDLSHPHNFLLDFWVRLGIAGPMIFALLQIAFWRIGLHVYHQLASERNALWLALCIGTLGAMANTLAHGLIDNSYFVLDLAYILMLLLACVPILSSSNTRSIDEAREKVV